MVVSFISYGGKEFRLLSKAETPASSSVDTPTEAAKTKRPLPQPVWKAETPVSSVNIPTEAPKTKRPLPRPSSLVGGSPEGIW